VMFWKLEPFGQFSRKIYLRSSDTWHNLSPTTWTTSKPSFSLNYSVERLFPIQTNCAMFPDRSDLQDSTYKCELLGLNLLCLLSQNRVAEFHTELELFAYPDVHILENVYIKHAVSLEQYLMEGRYNKVVVIGVNNK